MAEYMARSRPLLALDLPKILFMPEACIAACRPHAHTESTTFVPFEAAEMATEMPIETSWQLPPRRGEGHDTHEYMQVMLHKTAWMVQAAELRPTATHLLWVDLGLIHVFPGRDPVAFQRAVRQAAQSPAPPETKVCIAGIWPHAGLTPEALQGPARQHVLWYLAGGVFGGHPAVLRRFHAEVKAELAVLAREQRCTWEVNVWALVLARCPELFAVYTASHNPTILTGYALPLGVSLVIPCVPAHVRYLAECVASARAQTRLPQEVVVALSSCAPAEAHEAEAAVRAASGPMTVRILAQDAPASAAENRNRGASASSQPIVSFMDADDTMHPQRLERVVGLLQEHRADAVLHGFAHNSPCDAWEVGSGNVIAPEEACLREAADRTCVHLTFAAVTHGHITVRRRIIEAVQQDPRAARREDSLFVRQVFEAGFRVAITDDRLSTYWQERSTGH